MPRWLLWFIIAFVVVNGLAIVANLPNPFTLIYDFLKNPPVNRRTLDAGIQGIGMAMGIAMLLGWGIIALVFFAVFKARSNVPPTP